MDDEQRAEAAGVADFLKVVSAVHRRDDLELTATMAALSELPTHALLWVIECAARTHLAALAALSPDPAAVSACLDQTALACLDRLTGRPDACGPDSLGLL